MPEVIIIGGGFSGIAMAVQLRRKLCMQDFLIIERSSALGGVWANNRYPGVACDIPSALYSFSFGQQHWDDLFSSGDKIQAYIEQTAYRNHLEGNIRLDTTVTDAIWSDDQNTWTITTHSKVGGRQEYTSKILISAVGNLTIPAKLHIDGLDRFRGKIMHTNQYDRGVDLKGKDVVVVGNGCTCASYRCTSQKPYSLWPVQALVPSETNSTNALALRLPLSVHYSRKNPAPLLNLCGLRRRLQRHVLEIWSALSTPAGDGIQAIHRTNSANSPAKDPYPRFRLWNKSLVFDNGFFASLHLAHVDYKTERISAIVEEGVLDQDGKLIPADVIIAATGYQAQQYLLPLRVKGQHGADLREHMRQAKLGLSSYKGTFYSGFPNFATVYGPNTGTGHSSAIFSQECQIDMIIKRLVTPVLRDEDVDTVAVRPEAERKWMEWLRKEMAETVWEQERQGWYTDNAGLCTTLYPKGQLHFWWSTWNTPASDFIHSPRDSKVLYGSVKEMEYVLYIFLYLAFILCVACL